jgi:hypothetical protein
MRPKYAALAAIASFLLAGTPRASAEDPTPQRPAAIGISDAQVEKLGVLVSRLLEAESVDDLRPVFSNASETSVYIDIRDSGRAVYADWGRGKTPLEALEQAISGFHSLRSAARSEVDAAVLNVAYDFRPVQREQVLRLPALERGSIGLQVDDGQQTWRLAPSEFIAQNLTFEEALESFPIRAGERRGQSSVRLQTFAADQFHVALSARGKTATKIYRGAPLISLDQIKQAEVRALSDSLAGWLFANLRADGRMTYLYQPSAAEESSANNSIRQWMATVAMTRWALERGDARGLAAARSNIKYNLETQYRKEPDGRGLIFDRETVKLGAVALAALAIIEHPSRAEFREQELSLLKTVDSLWLPTGEFRTFERPATRNDNQNFYPGEALLLWAALYEESARANRPDRQLLDRFMRSFDHYQNWHRGHRNPAFVPWHTQAYYRVWRRTGESKLAVAIFEMNDWLVDTMQQWAEIREHPDAMGRFYSPHHDFGPPHASSTGVYLEGLIDAWCVAERTGDDERRERYRLAIMRGLRSTMQLAYKDDLDMFYIEDRKRALGGVRTNVYDNAIRVDNVQHNLMAIIRILDEFAAKDFRP